MYISNNFLDFQILYLYKIITFFWISIKSFNFIYTLFKLN